MLIEIPSKMQLNAIYSGLCESWDYIRVYCIEFFGIVGFWQF